MEVMETSVVEMSAMPAAATTTMPAATTTMTATATTSHTYASAGSKTVTLTVTDNYGVVSAPASKVVTVG